jgi:hypothetical protein
MTNAEGMTNLKEVVAEPALNEAERVSAVRMSVDIC